MSTWGMQERKWEVKSRRWSQDWVMWWACELWAQFMEQQPVCVKLIEISHSFQRGFCRISFLWTLLSITRAFLSDMLLTQEPERMVSRVAHLSFRDAFYFILTKCFSVTTLTKIVTWLHEVLSRAECHKHSQITNCTLQMAIHLPHKIKKTCSSLDRD